MLKNTSLFPLLLLTMLSTSSSGISLAWELPSFGLPSFEAPTNITNMEPAFYMEKATTVEFNQIGLPNYRLHATRVQAFQDERDATLSFTQLTQPYLIIYSQTPNEAPWHLKAQDGYLDNHFHQNGQYIFLQRLVHLNRDTLKGKLTIDTQKLCVDTTNQVFQTKEPIQLKQPNSRVDAIGMTGSLNSQTLMLHQSVESEYAPN